ncbi:zinc finger CCCH domain-containing protein 48-like [Bidens hawaiensis]|uniref:zinc finger CCCH domain-containing protein 48-like n=1 Tax=Bidens hawaiensis TaxID=980011 RepID=UPI00404B051E
MALVAGKRLSIKTDTSMFKRLGGRRSQENNAGRNHQAPVVCKYWLKGRCTRNPCKFLHPERAKPDTVKSGLVWKNPNSYNKLNTSPPKPTFVKNNPNSYKLNSPPPKPTFVKNKENCDHNKIVMKKTEQKVLPSSGQSQTERVEKTENGVKDEKCHNLQSWFGDNGLSLIAQLEGHSKGVTGIVLPHGTNTLYCTSKDKSLRVWDCNSGKCGDVINFDEECGTLVEQGPWIFAGLQNMIKACNRETQPTVVIQASGGMVNAITMFEDTLFAGMEDGTVLSWKSTSKNSFAEEATCLKGHTGSVLSLIVGAKQLFSGSADRTIRVWDAESLECKHVLNGHTSDVTSVICWEQYLFSGSLDKTIKVWSATASGNIEEVFQHNVDNGVLAFCGTHDAEEKPILLCSCKDDGVRIFDLPSFAERGRIYSRHDVKAIQVGPESLFFTGDAAGLVSVWKPNGESVKRTQQEKSLDEVIN